MGFHPEFSSFDRRTADLGEARRSLWLWAEPIIIDRAVEVYARIIDETGTIAMARRHCRLWRVVLGDQPGTTAAAMDEARRAADSLGLPGSVIDGVNDVILEELVDIVMSRYRASRNSAKTFSMVLMSATSSLGSVRAVA
jgi:hypothetical protein